MQGIIGLGIAIGAIASFVWVIDTLAALKTGQAEILTRLAHIERTQRTPLAVPNGEL